MGRGYLLKGGGVTDDLCTTSASGGMEEESHDFGLLVRRPRSRFTRGSGAFSPLPSLALVKFWQGRVEFALRILCVVRESKQASGELHRGRGGESKEGERETRSGREERICMGGGKGGGFVLVYFQEQLTK